MKRRKTGRMLWRAFRTSGAGKIYLIFLIYFVIVAVILQFVEPNIKSFPDSLWYCFAVSSTIGFGDISAVSAAGRILTVILSIYSVAVVAVVTAVITSFFLDMAKIRARESTREFLDQLEHLSELSKEELDDLSDKVRRFRP